MTDKFKYAFYVRGSEENKTEFVKELEKIGYSKNPSSIGIIYTLLVNPINSHCSMKNGEYCFWESINSARTIGFDIDEKWQFQAALAVATVRDDEEYRKGDMVWVKYTKEFCSFSEECNITWDRGHLLTIYRWKETDFAIAGQQWIASNYVTFDNDDVRFSARNNTDYIVRKATAEDIIEHFKTKYKITNMAKKEKRIIGYRFKNEAFREAASRALDTSKSLSLDYKSGVFMSHNSMVYDRAVKLGVLDVWFSAVYEEEKSEFKPGDWVYFTGEGALITEYWTIGRICKIFTVGDEILIFEATTGGFASAKMSGFRLATEKEKKDYFNINLGGYNARMINGLIAFGCKAFDKRELLTLHGLLSIEEARVYITVQDSLVNAKLIDKLLEMLNNNP